MDQDDLEDEVFTKTILAHLDLLTTSSRQLFEWQRRYIQTEIIYAIAFLLSVVLCVAKRKGKEIVKILLCGPSMMDCTQGVYREETR